MTYTDPSVSNERRVALVEIGELLLDAETKINEGFARPEVLDDLMRRIADNLVEVLPEMASDLDAMRVGTNAYAYPAHCDGCGQEPGTGVRLHGCDVCAERNRINDEHAAEPLDTGETTQDLGSTYAAGVATYRSAHASAGTGDVARREATRIEDEGTA